MQPYILPYIGYLQLLNAVDVFVLYDDVNYINKGWINRNRILVNKEVFTYTIPCKKASQNKLIMDTEISGDGKWRAKLLKTISMAYTGAEYFKDVFPLIEKILMQKEKKLHRFTGNALNMVMNYLQMNTRLVYASKHFNASKGLDRADRLISICQDLKADTYINAKGGKSLYEKDYFASKGIELVFINNTIDKYPQFVKDFVPGLSIIDIMMHVSVPDIQQMLMHYKLD
jgi:hypothetical protein